MWKRCVSTFVPAASLLLTFFPPLVQAFIKTAESIYEKIKSGVYDPSREGNGVKLGVMAAGGAKGAGSAKSAGGGGGCC